MVWCVCVYRFWAASSCRGNSTGRRPVSVGTCAGGDCSGAGVETAAQAKRAVRLQSNEVQWSERRLTCIQSSIICSLLSCNHAYTIILNLVTLWGVCVYEICFIVEVSYLLCLQHRTIRWLLGLQIVTLWFDAHKCNIHTHSILHSSFHVSKFIWWTGPGLVWVIVFWLLLPLN